MSTLVMSVSALGLQHKPCDTKILENKEGTGNCYREFQRTGACWSLGFPNVTKDDKHVESYVAPQRDWTALKV